jgi:hypothetical protein
MHAENYGQALKGSPLSSNKVILRIGSVLEGIKEQLLTRIECSPTFALEIYELTDFAGLPQLLVFFRYYFKGNIHEDFMFY